MNKTKSTGSIDVLGVHSLRKEQFIANEFASHRSTVGPECGPVRARGEIEPLLEEVSEQLHKLRSAVGDLAGHLSPVLGPDSPMDLHPAGPSQSAVGGALADFAARINVITAEVEQIRRRSQV